jgi:hypothetical protein
MYAIFVDIAAHVLQLRPIVSRFLTGPPAPQSSFGFAADGGVSPTTNGKTANGNPWVSRLLCGAHSSSQYARLLHLRVAQQVPAENPASCRCATA